MFLSVLETDSDMHVDSGVDTTHAVMGVACLKAEGKSVFCVSFGGRGMQLCSRMDRYSYVQREKIPRMQQ
jgi:hypothetical protein